jgi:hypothetical protein
MPCPPHLDGRIWPAAPNADPQCWNTIMKAFALKIALSTFLVAAPVGAAIAAGIPANIVDGVATPIAPEAYQPMTRIQTLNARITAAEANLQPTERGGYANPDAAAQAQADLISIRQAAADSERAGSRMSEKAYQSLTGQLEGVERLIQQAQNG